MARGFCAWTSGPTDPPVTEGSRKRFGRFYTPAGVADLALGLALRSPTDRVWDPTCGDGAFLRRADARGHPRHLLTGHDLDPAAVESAGVALPGACLEACDLFGLDPDRVGPFDVIVGNPPFVRNERLPAARRPALRRALAERLGWEPPAQADLSVLALLWCVGFLAPGGRLSFVMPNTWMDAAFARDVRRRLLERTRLVALVESRSEPWFPEAKVNTVIVTLERPGENRPPRPTVFARCLAPASGDLAGAILDGRPDPRLELRRATATPARWSPLLRAPDVWFEVLSAAGDALVKLGDPERPRLRRAYGTKTGITAFFCPDPAELDRVGVEPELRRPFLRTLKGLSRYRITRADVPGELFVCPGEVDPGRHPGAAAWIARGEVRRNRNGTRWPEVPSVRNNQPWYVLGSVRGGDVILPQFRAERHHVIANPDRVPVNNSAWWGSWLDPALREGGVALLNSTWMALAAEVVGRVNLGEGLLTCYGPDLDELPMPDPARFVDGPLERRLLQAWDRLSARDVLPLPAEIEQPDRIALDAVVLEGLGLPLDLGPRIRRQAARLCTERSKLATALRDARAGGDG